MDSYAKNGMFPNGMLDNENWESNEKIRCHYRPRSILPLLLFSLWTYLCLPQIFNLLKCLMGTGPMTLAAGFVIFGLSMYLYVIELIP